MARGMVVGEKIVTQAETAEYDAGYERTFGTRKAERGRWVWDASVGRLVPFSEYRAPQLAVDAPIMAGRFYENTAATDGTDIGSRRKHRDYMRQNGLTTIDDYRDTWAKAANERAKMDRGDFDHRARRDDIGRAMYQLEKGSR